MRQKKHGSYANHITSGRNDLGSIKKEREQCVIEQVYLL